MNSLIKKSMFLVLAAWAFISCESPIQSGLGNRVDINPPKLTVKSPSAGSFLHDLVTFNVEATDDILVTDVEVYAAMEADFDPKDGDNTGWVSINPPEQSDSHIWTWQKSTANEEDGIFIVRFRATDGKEITKTEDLVYTIKNLPPRVDLNLPNFSLKDRKQLLPEDISIARNGLSIDSGGVLVGYATDIQGIRDGSPQIKLWREGEPKPQAWSPVDEPVWGVINPNSVGSKGREFRYYITNHQELDSSSVSGYRDPKSASPLDVGDYRLQLQVTDTGGVSAIFPPTYKIDGIDYDSLLIHVTPSYETPRLEVDFSPNNIYQAGSFIVEAKASHSAGIENVYLQVRKSGDLLLHDLKWDSREENNNALDINGSLTKSLNLESYFIIPGGTYPERGGGDFSFDSGTYEFEVQAVSKAGARFTYTQTIYVDNTKPTVQITQVDPGIRVEPDRWNEASYINLVGRDADRASFSKDTAFDIQEGYIVNGKVTINVASFDQNGLGTFSENNTEVRNLRYLLAKVNYSNTAAPATIEAELKSILPWDDASGALNPELMYNSPDSSDWINHSNGSWIAGYLDDLIATAHPKPFMVSPTQDIITLDTDQIFPNSGGGTGELYLFVTAKDKANNLAALTKGSKVIGYHLRVNQGADKPWVKLTDLSDTVHTLNDLPNNSENIMSTDVKLRGTLNDDDGIIVRGRTNYGETKQAADTVSFELKSGSVIDENDWKVLPLNQGLIGKTGRSLEFKFTKDELGKAFDPFKTIPDGVYQLRISVKDAGFDLFGDQNQKNGANHLEGGIVSPPVFFAVNTEGATTTVSPVSGKYADTTMDLTATVTGATTPLRLKIVTPFVFNNIAEPIPDVELLRYWDFDYIKYIRDQPSLTDAVLESPLITPNLGKILDAIGGLYPTLSTDTARRAKLMEILTIVYNSFYTTLTPPLTPVADPTTHKYTWTWTLPLKFDQNHLALQLRGEDFFLAKNDLSVVYQIDKEYPVVEFQYPPEDGYITGNDSIRGIAWDPNRVEQLTSATGNGEVNGVYYWITPPGSPNANPPTGAYPTNPDTNTSTVWKNVSAAGFGRTPIPWTIPITIGAGFLTEGDYTVWVIAMDAAQHWNDETTHIQPPGQTLNQTKLRFGVDVTPPGMTLNTGGADTTVDPPSTVSSLNSERTGLFTLAGTTNDTNGIQSISINQVKTNGTSITWTGTYNPGTTGIDWTGSSGDFNNTHMLGRITQAGSPNAGRNWGLNLANLPWKSSSQSYNPGELANGAQDGEYTYTITVTDVANRPVTLIRRVILDTRAPVVEFDSDNSSYFETMNGSFKGTAIDQPNGTGRIAQIRYKLVTESDVPPIPTAGDHPKNLATTIDDALSGSFWDTKGWIANDLSLGQRWTITDISISPGGVEGQRHIWAFAVDSAGNVGDIAKWDYSLDLANPSLSEDLIISSDAVYKDGSNIVLAGFVGDSNQIKSLRIRQYKDNDGVGDYAITFEITKVGPSLSLPLSENGTYTSRTWTTAGEIKIITPPYAGTVNTSGLNLPVKNTGSHINPALDVDNGTYNYDITVTDGAGRTKTLTRIITIDNVRPVVTLNTPPKPSTSWYEGDKTSPSFRGASSDNISGVHVIYYKAVKDGATIPKTAAAGGGSVDPKTMVLNDLKDLDLSYPGWDGAGGTVSSWNFTLSAANLAEEGTYNLFIIAEDGAGNRGTLLSGAAITWYEFKVDGGAPKLKETNAYPIETESGFTNSIAEVPTYRPANFNMSLTLEDTNALRIVEVFQKKNDAPAVKILDQPLTNLQKTTLELINLPWTGAATAGSTGNKITINGTAESNPGGIYTYEINVYDIASVSAASPTYGLEDLRKSSLTKTVTIDNTPPEVFIDSPDSSIVNFFPENAHFSLHAADAAPGRLEQTYVWVGLATDNPTLTNDNNATTGFKYIDEVSTNPLDYNRPQDPRWELLPIPAYASTAYWPTKDYTLGSSSTISSLQSTGQKRLVIIARDTAGLFSTPKTCDFWFDEYKPLINLKSNAPESGAWTNKAFTLDSAPLTSTTASGIYSADNGIKSVVITQQVTGIPGSTREVFRKDSGFTNYPTSPSYGDWAIPLKSGSLSLPRWGTTTGDGTATTDYLNPQSHDLRDGEYTYVITVTDLANNTETKTVVVRVDKTPPRALGNPAGETNDDIIITSPPANTYISGSTYWATGTVRDAPGSGSSGVSGIRAVKYRINNSIDYTNDTNANAIDPTSADWSSLSINPTSGTTFGTLEGNIVLTGLTEGLNKLWIIASDSAGNWSRPRLHTFYYDASKPTLHESHADSFAQGATFALTGNVIESNAVDKIIIKQKLIGLSAATMVSLLVDGDEHELPPILVGASTAPSADATGSYLTAVDKTDTGGGVLKNEALWQAANLPRRPASATNGPYNTAINLAAITDVLTIEYTITVYDAAGKTDELTRVVTIDKKGPDVTILSPSSNYSQSAPITIAGDATDSGGIAVVRYLITKQNVHKVDIIKDSPYAGDVTTYKEAGDSGGSTDQEKLFWPYSDAKGWKSAEGAWTKTLGTADLQAILGVGNNEGLMRLWVLAKDTAGNWSVLDETPSAPYPGWKDIGLDVSNPEIWKTGSGVIPGSPADKGDIGFTNINRVPDTTSGTNYARTGFTFTFWIRDTNALADGSGSPAIHALTVLRDNVDWATAAKGLTVTVEDKDFSDGAIASGNTNYGKLKKVTIQQAVGPDPANTNYISAATYTYNITVKDAVGKETTIDRIVVVDDVNPELSISSVSPIVEASPYDKVNGYFNFVASASDENGVTGIRYIFEPKGGADPTYTWSTIPTTGSNPHGEILSPAAYKAEINTNGLTGNYVLCIVTRDRAGNESMVFRYLTIDQAADDPRIKFLGWNAAETRPFADQGKITGTLSDDDGILYETTGTPPLYPKFYLVTVPGGVETPLTRASSANEEGKIWIENQDSTGVNTKEYTFSYAIPPVGNLADGTYKIKAVVSDDPAKKHLSPPDAAKTSTAEAFFVIDRTVPVITIATTLPTTARAGPFIIKGTLKEANVATFKVTLNSSHVLNFVDNATSVTNPGEYPADGAIPNGLTLYGPAANETRYWSYKIPTGNVSTPGDFEWLDQENVNNVQLEVADVMSQVAIKGGNFSVDSAGPDINFTNITEELMAIVKHLGTTKTHSNYSNNEATLRAGAEVITDNDPKLTGTFSDVSPLFASSNAADRFFYYRLDAGGDSTADTGWLLATGTEFLPSYASLTGLEKSTRWQIPLRKTEANPTFNGGLAESATNQRYRFTNEFLDEGPHTLDFKIVDRLGNVNRTTSVSVPNSTFDAQGYNFERVYFGLDSTAPVVVITPRDASNPNAINNGTAPPTMLPTDPAGTLSFKVQATVTDRNLRSVVVTMPGLTIASPFELFKWTNTDPINAAMNVGGYVDGTRIPISFNHPDYATMPSPYNVNPITIGYVSKTAGVIKVEIDRPFTKHDYDSRSDEAGEQVITIVATDGAREARPQIIFSEDHDAPTFSVTYLDRTKSPAYDPYVSNAHVAPASGNTYPTIFSESDPVIQGTIQDNYAIGIAKYKLEQYNYATRVWGVVAGAAGTGEWTGYRDLNPGTDYLTVNPAVKSATWTIRLKGSGGLNLGDGLYRISFAVQDRNSNKVPDTVPIIPSGTNSIKDILFFIDGATPVLQIKDFHTPPFYAGTDATLNTSAKPVSYLPASTSYDAMKFNILARDGNTIIKLRAKLDSSDFSTGTVDGYLRTDGTWDTLPVANPGTAPANYELYMPAFRNDIAAGNPGHQLVTDAIHTLWIETTDHAGKVSTTSKDFTFDSEKPNIVIIEPVAIAPDPYPEVTSQVTIRGVTTDNNSVKELYYLFGKTEISTGVTRSYAADTTEVFNGKRWRKFSAGIDFNGYTIAAASYTADSATSNVDLVQGRGSTYNWNIKLPNSLHLTSSSAHSSYYLNQYGSSDYLKELPIYFLIVDTAGNEKIETSFMMIVNPKGDQPTVTIASPNPANFATTQNEVGGVIQIIGSAKDNDWIHRVVFRVFDGNGTTGTPYSESNWTTDAVTNANYAALPTPDTRGGWYQAAITGTPGSNVLWGITLNNNGGLNPSGTTGRVVTIQVLAYDTPAANHNLAQTMGDPSEVKVTFVNGLPFVVTNDTKITPMGQNGGKPFFFTNPPLNWSIGGQFTLTTSIRDDNGLKELVWHGEDTTSYGSNVLQIAPSPGTPIYAKPVTAVPVAMLEAGKYYLVLEGPNRTQFPFLYGTDPTPTGLVSAFPALNEDGTPYTYAASKKGYIEYEVSLTLDSRTLKDKSQNFIVNRAGNYEISIMATDHTDFKMVQSWTLKLDNFFPLGTYTGNGVAAGTSYQLQGLAWDTGAGVTVQGIKKVVAWFSRGEQFIPLNEKAMGSGAAFQQATESINVVMGRTDANSGTAPALTTINGGGSLIKFPDLRYTRKYVDNDAALGNEPLYSLSSLNISGIEIDANEPTQDNDLDGFLEGLADAGMNYQWYGRIDTTKFNDGLLTVHYLVYDQAGNTSYYSNTIFISNNPPKVTSIDIGTDVLNVLSTADPRGHRIVTTNYGNTNFTVRNRQVSFKINISGDDGAKPFHYRFGYVTSRALKQASVLETGKIYSINEVGTVNWTAVGAPEGYGVGTTFMATDNTSYGVGSALELTLSNLQATNTNDHEVTYNYTNSDFTAITDTMNNNAWFVLRVYNSLKIPMIPDEGYTANGGAGAVGPDNTTPVYSVGPYGNPDMRFNIWDQPYDVVRIGLNVANDDIVKPEVKLWDFNPGGESAGVNGLNGLALTANGTAAQPPSSINLTPNAALSPNLLKGGLYNPRNNNRNIERSGHIEPRYAAAPGAGSYFIEGNHGLATFAKDTLSGEVILRGFAYDDQRLGAVYIKIGDGAEFPILQSDDSTTYNQASPGNRGLLVPVSGQHAFVYNQIDVAGHMAEWAYVWNTATLPANFVAGDNVKVQVRVADKRSAPNSSDIRLHTNTGESANGTTIFAGTNNGRYPLVLRNADGWRLDLAGDRGYNRIAVTLAPYVNSLQRDISKGYSSFRSRQGWYAFSRGETIVAQGWNLKFPGASTTVTLDTAASTTNAPVGSQTATGITFTVPNDAISGNVKLLANGVSTVNDRNDNRNPWNREDYNLTVNGNELWKDDRAAHIWHSDGILLGDNTRIEGSETPMDPAMTMNPRTAVLWGSWANTNDQAVYMNTNVNTLTTEATRRIIHNNGGGGLDSTDIYYSEPQRSSGTNSAHPTVAYHDSRTYSSNYSVTASGGIKLYDPIGRADFESNTTGMNHQYNVELTYHNEMNQQFKHPRVVYRGDNMHVTYYDTKDKSLKYWFGRSGYNPTTANYTGNATVNAGGLNAPARHWINLDGGSDADDTSGTNRVRGTGGAEGTNTFTRASKAGPWSAIDLQSDGKPVIAYFDDENARLRIAYADVVQNPLVTQWKVKYAMPTTDENYHFSGQYVSMQIDQTNNDAHLAFYNSSTPPSLIYLKLQWTGGTYVPSGPSVIIDESGANGKWVDLTLDKQNRPWISYQDITRAGDFDGVKMAYYDPAKYPEQSWDINGIEKTGWETMNVPAIYKASDSRTSIEVWPHRDTPTTGTPSTITKTWAAAVAYTNPDYYRIAYYIKPKN